jgi:hypothetical protein
MKLKQYDNLQNKRVLFLVFSFLFSFSFVCASFIPSEYIPSEFIPSFVSVSYFLGFENGNFGTFWYSFFVGILCFLFYHLVLLQRAFVNRKDNFEEVRDSDSLFFKSKVDKVPLIPMASQYLVINLLYGRLWKIIVTSILLWVFTYIPFVAIIPRLFQLLFLKSWLGVFPRILLTCFVLTLILSFFSKWFYLRKVLSLRKNVKNIKKIKKLVEVIEKEAENVDLGD